MSDDRLPDPPAEITMADPRSPVRLRRVPLPLRGSERFQWRLTATLAALAACRGKSAGLDQLHTMVWAISDPLNARTLASHWDRDVQGSGGPTGYVPELLDVLRVAQAETLIEQLRNGRQKLTPQGREVISRFRKDIGSLGDGDDFFTRLAPIATAEWNQRMGGAT